MEPNETKRMGISDAKAAVGGARTTVQEKKLGLMDFKRKGRKKIRVILPFQILSVGR
jgi:hypothetical protein